MTQAHNGYQHMLKYDKKTLNMTKNDKNMTKMDIFIFYRLRREKIFKNGSFIFFYIFFFYEQLQIVNYHHLCSISQLATQLFFYVSHI